MREWVCFCSLSLLSVYSGRLFTVCVLRVSLNVPEIIDESNAQQDASEQVSNKHPKCLLLFSLPFNQRKIQSDIQDISK